jgi:hypothetical protein
VLSVIRGFVISANPPGSSAKESAIGQVVQRTQTAEIGRLRPWRIRAPERRRIVAFDAGEEAAHFDHAGGLFIFGDEAGLARRKQSRIEPGEFRQRL